ncbi:MAG: response regulator [Myxococcales bacterium]|nr:response regulator [Myxococcales bacterium]
MARVLIVEDEVMLRSSLARGLARLEGVEVVDAGTVVEALALIDARPPDLVLSDIDLPERTGIELLGELASRGLRTPVIFMSAYLQAYGALIPRHADIEVLEKPIALAEIRERVLAKLKPSDEPEPFSVVDFLQLAAMGRRSVEIQVVGEGLSGTITIHEGNAWDARVGDRVGLAAFDALAWAPRARIHCRTIAELPAERSLHDPLEGLLMRSAQRLDEETRDGRRVQRLSSAPPAPAIAPLEETPEDDGFDALLDEGIEAVVTRDWETAWRALSAAEVLQPEHPLVKTNLARLRELGYAPAAEEE